MAMSCISGRGIDSVEAQFLASPECPLESLLAWGGRIRDQRSGSAIRLCSIVNARSGKCAEDCSFCAQSAHHATSAAVHCLLPVDEIVAAAKAASAHGATCFGIVSSGRRATPADLVQIAMAIEAIRRECGPGMMIGASLGCLEYEELCYLRSIGLGHYNHNLETSEAFYPRICTTHTWGERYRTVKNARNAGLHVCSGGLFGLGESWEDRIALALSLRELKVNNVPINFLMPIPGTMTEKRSPLNPDEALRVIALYRFMLPDAAIRICGGRAAVFGKRQADMFEAGASGLLTGNYLTTQGEDTEMDKRLIAGKGLRLENC
jgi:biotin synthase